MKTANLINSFQHHSSVYCPFYPPTISTMATYFVSIHDLQVLSSRTEDTEATANCWPHDADSDQSGNGDDEGMNAVDSWSLDSDADSDRLDSGDHDEERKSEQLDRQEVVGRSGSCSGASAGREIREQGSD